MINLNGRTKRILSFIWAAIFFLYASPSFSVDFGYIDGGERQGKRKKEMEELQKRFEWWPTDATPGPVKDEDRGGYWWWPTTPGDVGPLWGNRGWVYIYKIIFDYKEEELPPPKPRELRPSLLIKKIIKNVKIYFDYNKADLRDDVVKILEEAVGTLRRNPEASILITGNCDIRGTEEYNIELGKRRAAVVKNFMLENGVTEERIKIVSRGKLDAIAYITDLVGMQKDRNAQFMIAEVEEVMIPYPGEPRAEDAGTEVKPVEVEEGKYLVEEEVGVESQVRVSTKEYTVQKGDTLWKIAEEQLGSGYRWQYLYELNKERIADPDKLAPGTDIIIPIE